MSIRVNPGDTNKEIDSSFWDTIGLGDFEETAMSPEMLEKYNQYMADLEAFGNQDRSVDAEGALNRAGDIEAAQRGERSFGEQERSVMMARDAALGNAPSAAELQGRRQLDQAQQQNIGLARSGGGASGMRAALYANAKSGQGAAGDAAAMRAQEMATARGQYMQGTQGLSGAADQMRGRAQSRAAMDIGSRELGQDRKLNAGSLALSNTGNTLGNIVNAEENKLNRAAGHAGAAGQTGASVLGGGLSATGAVVSKLPDPTSDSRVKADVKPSSMHSEWGGKSTPSLGGPRSIKEDLRPAPAMMLDIKKPQDLSTLLSPKDMAVETFRFSNASSPLLPVADRMFTGEKAAGLGGALTNQILGMERKGMGDQVMANLSSNPSQAAAEIMSAESRAPQATSRDMQVESASMAGGSDPNNVAAMNRGRLDKPQQFMVDAMSAPLQPKNANPTQDGVLGAAAPPIVRGMGMLDQIKSGPKDFMSRITSAIDSKSDLMPSHMPWGPESKRSLGGPAEIKSDIAPVQGPLRTPDQRGAPINYGTRNWLSPSQDPAWTPAPAGSMSDAELYSAMKQPMRNLGQEQDAAQAGADAIAQSNSNIDNFLAKRKGVPGDDESAYEDALKAFDDGQRKEKMAELSKAYVWDAPEKDAATPGDGKGMAAKPKEEKASAKGKDAKPKEEDKSALGAGLSAFGDKFGAAVRPYAPNFTSVPMAPMTMLPGKPSDPRAKKNMEAAKSPIDDFMDKAEGFTYKYKSPEFEDGTAAPGTTHMGPMADDLRKVKGGIGETLTYEDPKTGLLGVNTGRLSLANAAAVNELHERIKELEAKRRKGGK